MSMVFPIHMTIAIATVIVIVNVIAAATKQRVEIIGNRLFGSLSIVVIMFMFMFMFM